MVLEQVLYGMMCFVLSYYSLDLLFRKFYISRFFGESRISTVPRTISLSLRSRFFIQFFTASFMPLFIMILIQAGSPEVSPGEGTLQHPIRGMTSLTRSVIRENYSVQVPVVSKDELGQLGEAFNAMTQGLQEKQVIKDAFGRLVDPRVRDYVLENNNATGGTLKRVAILFTDIRDFTSLSEQYAPQDVVKILNMYFEKMSHCVEDAGGIVGSPDLYTSKLIAISAGDS